MSGGWNRKRVALALLSASTFAYSLAFPADSTGNASKETRVTFRQQVLSIIEGECLYCHLTGAEQGDLNLEDGGGYEALVSQPSKQSKYLIVAPGDPGKSYLLAKIEGTHPAMGGSGERMPPLGPLAKEQIEIIRAWIVGGAKKD